MRNEGNPEATEGMRGDAAPDEAVKGVETAYFHHVLTVESGEPTADGDPWGKAESEFPAQADGINRLKTVADRADRISETFPGMYRELVRTQHFSDVEDTMAQRMLADVLISRACEHRSTRSPEEMEEAAADLRREFDPDGGDPTAKDIVKTALEGRLDPETELGPPRF
ncbi:MAG: hypothetical protein WD603_01515 [Patescibacteria group bacterium]